MFECLETIDLGFDAALPTMQRVRALERQLHASMRKISRLRANLSRYRTESERDELTGLANRRRFVASLRDAVCGAAREAEPFCLMILDIDHFKHFNDTYGHLMGDAVLRIVARTLSDGVRQGDLVARHGGEEFAVVLPGVPLTDAVATAERLREALGNRTVLDPVTGERVANVTCSIGVAAHHTGESGEALLHRCDAALYQAKRNGRDRVEAAAPPVTGHDRDFGVETTSEWLRGSVIHGINASNRHGRWEATSGAMLEHLVGQAVTLASVEYL